MPELELNGLQESPPPYVMLLINQAFCSPFFFLIKDEKIRFFKGNFQKHVFYFSL